MNIKDSEDVEEVLDFFLSDESKHLFLKDDLSRDQLRDRLVCEGWEYCCIGDYHITAYLLCPDGYTEAHTYTNKSIPRDEAIGVMLSVGDYLKSSGHTCLVTYVPELYKSTANFLIKRTGFIDEGVCATANIKGETYKINRLIRRL